MRAIVLAVALPFATAHAQTIDFEALQTPTPAAVRIDDVTGDPFRYEEDGFVVEDTSRIFGLYRWGRGSQQYIANGSTNLFNNGPGGITRLSRADGSPFSLAAIDLAELSGFGAAPVTFVGTRVDGSVITHAVAIDGLAFYPETFLFPAAFHDLVAVEWEEESPYHTFDNIEIGDGFGLTLSTTCPAGGPATFTWQNGTPAGDVALIRGLNPGSFTVPAGVCTGATLGLRGGVGLIGVFRSDAAGDGAHAVALPPGACGRYVEALDLSSCTASGPAIVQ